MTDLTCPQAEELLAGYAADALEEQELCSVSGHLAECRNHDLELAAMRSDFDRLGASLEPVEPPATLRAGLLDAFDRALVAPGSARQLPTAPTAARHRAFSVAGFGYALAAALLIVAIGLGAWGLSRGGGTEDVLVRTATQGDAQLRLTYVAGQHTAVLDVDLPALPSGRTYQAWQISGGEPVSLGLLPAADGPVAFDVDLSDASAIALSVEPAGGSIAPTTDPILLTPLDKG